MLHKLKCVQIEYPQNQANLYLLTETNTEKFLKQIDELKPDLVIVDSIQDHA